VYILLTHHRLDNASYTTSVTSSVLDYQYVNG
jgi:hypothetical protein